MNILVTGGSGTIGGYVLRELLQAGHAVSSFSRSAPRIDGAGFIQGDIMDPDRLVQACHGQDAVIHLAAVPGPGRATPAQLLNINVVGTANVLEAALSRPASTRSSSPHPGAATGFSFQKHALLPQLSPARRSASQRAAGRVRAEQAAGRADLQALQRRIRHPDHLPAHQQQLVS